PYAQPYPSAQPYLQQQPQPQPQFAPQPAFPSQPQAPFVRRKSPSTPPPAESKSKLRDKANATVGSSERLRFVRRTYLHLFMAILAFAGLEYLLVTNDFLVETISIPFTKFALGGRWNWAIVLGVFMVVSWIADYWARHASSRVMQYLGLGFYVIAEALIFVPLLAIVAYKTQSILARGGGEPHILRDSALVTLALFGALTASVLLSRKDFSFLRTGLAMASAAALMLIGLSLVFGFNLGIVFSVAMVLLAAAYILYQTSQVLAHYDPNQHVAASLALFSSVALMFWYMIRIVMKMRE
ncbi:MAG TPA: Bax inhibitor-1 family protein, partial [Kofleriaceae bacterium]